MIQSALISLLYLTRQSYSSGWDYHEMTHWSDEYTMCDNEDESPINIVSLDAVYDDEICNAFFDWDIEYEYTDFKVTNNGHAIVLQAVQESNIDPDGDLADTLFDTDGSEYQTLGESENTIAKFENYFRPENSIHEEFCLHSLHFHWGLTGDTGSEHFVDGHQYPLEAHFVHYSCAHASLGTTLDQFKSERNVDEMKDAEEDVHQLGVVGIFFDVIEADDEGNQYINPAFEALLNDDVINDVTLPDHSTKIIHEFNLKELIPEDVEIDGYYSYEGSLTTPPCTNIVRWHVMQARGKIGFEQMEQFRKLKHIEDEEEVQIAPNYRLLQENVNTVYGCMDAPVVVDNEGMTKAIVWLVAVFAMLTPVAMGFICCRKAKKELAKQGDAGKAGNTKH